MYCIFFADKDFFRRIYDSNINYELFCLYLAGSVPHSQTRVTGAAATADRARGGKGERGGWRDRQIKKYYFQNFLFLFISIDKNVNKNTNITNYVSIQATCRKNCLISF